MRCGKTALGRIVRGAGCDAPVLRPALGSAAFDAGGPGGADSSGVGLRRSEQGGAVSVGSVVPAPARGHFHLGRDGGDDLGFFVRVGKRAGGRYRFVESVRHQPVLWQRCVWRGLDFRRCAAFPARR